MQAGTALEAPREFLRRLGRRYGRLSSLFGLTIVLYAASAAALYASGRLNQVWGSYLLVVPLLFLAVLRPAWLVVILVAVPPAWMDHAAAHPLAVVLTFAFVVHVSRRGEGLSRGLVGILPIVALFILGYVHPATVPQAAATAESDFLKTLAYYLALGVLSFSLVRTGDLTVRQLVAAFLIGAGVTALGLLATVGFNPANLAARSDPSLRITFHSHFGYLSAIGFLVSFAWALSDDGTSRVPRPYRLAIATFFAATTALAFTRGAWLAALIGLLYVPRRTRKLAFVSIVPVAIALLLIVPSARARLLSDVSEGGVSQAISSGQIGTGRWGLWQRLYQEGIPDPVDGHGAGFTFSLDSRKIFGFEGEFGTGTFVYPHNDFLYWFLEFGLVGVALYLAFWLAVGSRYRRLMRHPDRRVRYDALLLSGVLVTMFVAEVVDNGIFMRLIAERFFVAAGALFALTRLHEIRAAR